MVHLVPYDASFEKATLDRICEFFRFHRSLIASDNLQSDLHSLPDGGSHSTLAEWLIPPNALFVIISADASVGFLRINYRGPNVAWIEDIYVDIPYRRRGIASSAIAAAETIIRNMPGYSAVCLDVSPRNEAAMRLYHKIGYTDLSLITVRKEFGSSMREEFIRFYDLDYKF